MPKKNQCVFQSMKQIGRQAENFKNSLCSVFFKLHRYSFRFANIHSWKCSIKTLDLLYFTILWINKQAWNNRTDYIKERFFTFRIFWLNFVKNGCPTVHLTMDRFLLCIPQQSVCENWVLAAALYVWGTVLQTDKSGHFQGYFIQQHNPLSDNSDLRSNQWFAVTPLVWGHHTTTGIR